MMQPLPPDPLPHDAEIQLRQAFRPKATEEEWQTARDIIQKALNIILIVVCENEKVIIAHLKKLGAGKVVASVIARLLKTIC